METIDSHMHIFNLKYLPVAGILRQYSNFYIPHTIAMAIERYLVRKTKSDFVKKSGEEVLLALAPPIEPIAKKLNLPFSNMPLAVIALTMPDKLFQLKSQEFVDLFCQEFDESDLADPVIAEALILYDKEINGTQEGFNFSSVGPENFFEDNHTLLGSDIFKQMFNWAFEIIDFIPGKILEGIRLKRWFAFMLNSEKDIFNHLFDQGKPDIVKHLHLMMDVDYYFNKPDTKKEDYLYKSYFDFEEEQIPNMAEMIKEFSDKLIVFVAFDPQRDNCLEIVKGAISQGFSGVKYYPSMGYKPFYDNPVSNFEIKVQKNSDALFKYCSSSDPLIPIFAHCNNSGFESNSFKHPRFPTQGLMPSGYNCNPGYWEIVLEKYKDLKLNLGHAGGSAGWFTSNKKEDATNPDEIIGTEIQNDSEDQVKSSWNTSYAAMVYKLCVKYDNVYCDFSFLDDMVNPNGKLDKKLKDNFKNRLLNLFESQPKFSTRIMYGSDLHMLFKEGKELVYYPSYVEFFTEKDSPLNKFALHFFFKNAMNYLGKTTPKPVTPVTNVPQ